MSVLDGAILLKLHILTNYYYSIRSVKNEDIRVL